MTVTTLLRNASSQPTGISKSSGGSFAGGASKAVVIRLETSIQPKPKAKKSGAFGDLVARLESSEDTRLELEKARSWVGDLISGEEGETVKSLRLKRGLTQQKLADLIGTTQAQVARIERGNVDPQRSTCKKLREALGVSAEDLESMMDLQEKIFQERNEK